MRFGREVCLNRGSGCLAVWWAADLWGQPSFDMWCFAEFSLAHPALESRSLLQPTVMDDEQEAFGLASDSVKLQIEYKRVTQLCQVLH